MSFEEGSELIDKLGLRVQLFGKDLDKLFKNMECTIFLVVTRLSGDELYHPENLTDPKEMSLLRDLISTTNILKVRKLTIQLGEHYDKLWRAAKDFSDLCALNRKFILSEIPCTPYHLGPLDDETIPLMKSLLKLHDLRLLTDSSQPYEHQYGRRGKK
ncbi:hypothetical protein JMJ35_002896 [Cladonia borealis]|uniref:DUF6919 domain-containing protein n=1 Tax=Cladonia borealis TaxID=184061 RepID=A0AA39R5Z8_9LECA|nr:hypothetical protein JMJ35_002896 [Cladonia borealis]